MNLVGLVWWLMVAAVSGVTFGPNSTILKGIRGLDHSLMWAFMVNPIDLTLFLVFAVVAEVL